MPQVNHTATAVRYQGQVHQRERASLRICDCAWICGCAVFDTCMLWPGTSVRSAASSFMCDSSSVMSQRKSLLVLEASSTTCMMATPMLRLQQQLQRGAGSSTTAADAVKQEPVDHSTGQDCGGVEASRDGRHYDHVVCLV